MQLYRIACGVEYLGSNYSGWQRQPNKSTIQGCIENALSKIANQPIDIFCAGRTDAGVHARGQVFHFDTAAQRSEQAWILGTNSNLPKDIAITWAKPVDHDFHARFSALSRTYKYIIYNNRIRPAIDYQRVCWECLPLDATKMHQAAQYLLGENDFCSYRAAGCQSKTPIRRIDSIEVIRMGEHITMTITANAFLHHMVRNIVGVLLEIGRGDQPIEWTKQVLQARDRTQAGITAVPDGLYLMKVNYAKALVKY